MYNIILEVLSTFFVFVAISTFPAKNYIFIGKHKFHKYFIANIAFSIANLLMIIYSSINGFIPLLIQMIIFMLLGLKGIKEYSNNKQIFHFFYVAFIGTLMFSLFLMLKKNYNFNVTLIEIIAASFALGGSIFMNIYKNYIVMFLFYIIADILYLLFFFKNNSYIMVFQYFVFVLVGIISLYKEILRKR